MRGDITATISAVLFDPEARANANGGNDQVSDGHLQEPALYIAGMVRAFGGQMTDQNYFPWDLANLGQDLFDAPSVFNYYSPDYGVPGTTLLGGEFRCWCPAAGHGATALRIGDNCYLHFHEYRIRDFAYLLRFVNTTVTLRDMAADLSIQVSVRSESQ